MDLGAPDSSTALDNDELCRRLASKMDQRGDGAVAAARKMSELNPGATVSSKSVEAWRKGIRRVQARSRRSIQLYIDLPDHDGDAAENLAHPAPPPDAGHQFDEHPVRFLTSEPLLTGRQGALVDAVIERIRSDTGNLNKHHTSARRWVAEVLGLPVDSDHLGTHPSGQMVSLATESGE